MHLQSFAASSSLESADTEDTTIVGNDNAISDVAIGVAKVDGSGVVNEAVINLFEGVEELSRLYNVAKQHIGTDALRSVMNKRVLKDNAPEKMRLQAATATYDIILKARDDQHGDSALCLQKFIHSVRCFEMTS